MKILFDHQAFSMGRRGGIARYGAELLNGFRELTDISVSVSVLYGNNEYMKEATPRLNPMVSNKKGEKRKPRVVATAKNLLRKSSVAMSIHVFLSNYANKLWSVSALTRQDFDVFHPTYYDPYFLPFLKEKPFVVTVHDMIHDLFPEYFSPNDKTVEKKKLLVSKAKKVIAISENTKKDLMRLYGTASDKITVVHHANFWGEMKESPLLLPERYILYVGGRKRYKNFSFFLESITPILKKQNVFVVCIGGGVFDAEEKVLFRRLNIEENIVHRTASDQELCYAYKHAICLALPSLYEGFGLPILEAFACGCAVLLSRASCFPEIAGDGGWYFDPRDRSSIATATLNILEDAVLRKDLIQKGSERLKNFSLPKMIRETREVYEECLTS